MKPDMSDSDRVKLIKKTLKECGERVTPKKVHAQFRYETGRDYEVPYRPDPYEAGD